MKKYIKSEDVLQLLVDIEADMDHILTDKEKSEFYDGKWAALHDVATALTELLAIQDMDIEVELDDEDN